MHSIEDIVAEVDRKKAEADAKAINKKKRAAERKQRLDQTIAHHEETKKKKNGKVFYAIFGKDSVPDLQLAASQKSIELKDIRLLICSVIFNSPLPWVIIKASYLIEHVVLIVLDSLCESLYQKLHEENLMSNLSRFFPADLTRPTHVPSTPNYVFNGIPTLLKWSKRKAGGNRRKNEEMTLEWNEATTKSCLCHSKNENRTSKYCVHDFALLPQECLLTEEEMILNSYPLPCNTTEEEYRVIGDKKCHTAGEIPKMYAVDCEMCITTHGMELTRVSVVNDSLEVVYDEYVKPHHEILDYLTRFSGVTEEKLSCVETRLETVRHDLFELFNSDTILIGHSMENDLRALKLIHYRVVDTAILYSCFRGEQQYKRSLKSLAAEWLKETIQMTDHDSNEDARTAMKLALLKFKYGHRLGSQQENLCEYLSKNGKRTVLVDDACRCKRYAGSHTDCHGEASDEQLTKKMVGAIKGGQYDFLYVRLRALQKYYEGPECESAPPEFQAEKKVCEEMDEYVGEILSVIPKRTLAIVTGAHGNLHHMRRLLDEKNRGEGWSPEDEERLQQQIQTAKTTVSFFKVTNNRNLAAMDS